MSVGSLVLHGHQATADAILPLLPHLTELDVTHGALGDDGVAAIVASPAAANLRALAVGLNGLTDAACEAIAASPHLGALERLSLGDTFLAQPFAPPPETLTAIAHPYYAGYRIAERMFPEVNAITAAGVRAIGHAPGLGGLRELGLWALPIGGDGVVALAESPLFARLRALDLRKVQVGVDGAAALVRALEAPHALLGIDLEWADVPLAGLAVRARVAPARVNKAYLGIRFAPDDRAEVLAAIARWPHLHALDLIQPFADLAPLFAALDGRALTRLAVRVEGDDAVAQLCAWPGLPALTELAVHGPSVGDRGVRALLARAGALRHLDLSDTFVSEIEPLLAWPGLAQLQVLDLRDNRLPFAAVEALVDALPRLPALARLELYGNPVGWVNEEWTDWDGSVCGGQLVIDPALAALARRIPRRIAITIWDPR